ncbi:S8 family serine peptidase [Neobacillus kokaensis]|uniref:Minor extracellular protease vpr n=1 Tax=Neobacillus kokaensis TaxID=2759023 RepID=A0ABQ3N1K4_9BACI|nr:S8 family serine peptidase [Neobacillus kokaensis]GHH98810.1 minor extracellular protease vpr [Neobacillus kokaensis]
MKLLLSLLLAFQIMPVSELPTQTHTQTQTKPKQLIHPPIPKSTKETVAIVVLDRRHTEEEIKRLIKSYKGLRLRRIFQEALDGFSIQGTPEAIARLTQQQKQMIHVSPVTKYQVQTEESVKIIGGDEVRGFFDSKNKRLTGKGITVGVIDTGVDYTHPDLKPNYKGGQDLVDNDNDPMETQIPGKATIHGTHVAGIIAANGKIKGVAPEAKIVAYRALGPGGGGTTEQVLAAIDQAIKDKVDIVNLSLGNSINGPDLPISLALDRAVEKGIVAVAAAGNSGPNVWTVGSPGTSSKAISVGASTPTMEIPYLLIEGTRDKIRIQPMEGSVDWKLDRSYEIVDGGLGRKKDLKHVQGKIVLIKRGTFTFSEKAKNAEEAGAKAVLIYNNIGGGLIGNLDREIAIPVGSLPKKDGEFLKKQQPKTARLNIRKEKDQLADFSSRGPVTGTWEIKPDILAPGVAINSTVPGGYLSLQGTSMAAPHVAGACALIKQAHPDWTPEQIKSALMNTAKPLVEADEARAPNWNRTSKFTVPNRNRSAKPIVKRYRTFEQGAGRIQVPEAIKAESLVSPGSIRFGKYTERHNVHKVILHIENRSNQKQGYSFAVPPYVDGLDWRVPLSFTLEPKQSKKVTVRLIVDPEHFKRKIHDGYLKLYAGSSIISIPYLYVLEEPGYPRVMGFDFAEGDEPGTYRYEVYLPGGAEEFGIALFNPESYRFVGFLHTNTNVKNGLIREEFTLDELPAEGTYLAKVFAKKAGKEDYIETMITIVK